MVVTSKHINNNNYYYKDCVLDYKNSVDDVDDGKKMN